MDSITNNRREYEREYRKKNKERINERHKEWAQKNIDKIKKWAKKNYKQWTLLHPDEVRERYKKWSASHPGSANEHYKKWAKANPDKVRLNRKAQGYRRRGAVGKFTKSEWQDLCNKYDNKCLCCGEQKELTVDHVVSLKDGGSNTIDNLQPLCRSCNSRKGAKFIDYR